MKTKVLYEDTNILAIDKPSWILVDEIATKYPKFILAHRLDQGTSGVMLLAKNEKAYEFLKAQFKGRTIKKIYHAIVSGHLKNDHGIINKPIGRSPKDFRRHLSGRGARGEMREAETSYKVLKRFSYPTQPSPPQTRKENQKGTNRFEPACGVAQHTYQYQRIWDPCFPPGGGVFFPLFLGGRVGWG